MSKDYFSQYESPNIIIEPSVITCNPPSPKRTKLNSSPVKSPQHVDISFLDDFNIDEIVSCLRNSDDMHQYIEDYNELKGIHKTNEEVKLEVKSEENASLPFSELNKEKMNTDNTSTNDKNKRNNALEKINDSIRSEVLTLKGDINSSLSFEFIEHTQAEIKKSDNFINNVDNFIRIKVNIDLVSNENLKTNKHNITEINKTFNRVKAENKDIHSSKNNILNKHSELDSKFENVNTKLMTVNESKSASTIKSIILNKKDNYFLNMLEKNLLKYFHMKYSVIATIHCGVNSKIFKCKNAAGEEYAVKMLIHKTKKYVIGKKKEEMLLQVQYDIPKENLFCIFVYGSFTMKGNWCFVMEFYPRNLREVISNSNKPLNIHIIQDLARQLVAAVMLLRNNCIIHSDIKPSHILMNCSNDKLKLCGFDNAYYNHSVITSPYIGTMSYRSPEVILGYSSGFSIDVWSTGLVLYEMATRRKLFPGYTNEDMLHRQMLVLGNMPTDMITMSQFGASYFNENKLNQQFGFIKKGTKIIYNFNETDKISRTVYGAYFEHWAPSRTNNQKIYDTQKLNSFVNLLQKMIVLHPKKRLKIEFVFANPFIYNMYD